MSKNEHTVLNRIESSFRKDMYAKAWIPRRMAFRRSGGVDSLEAKPLFPGYVFIDTEDPYYVHRKLKGFSNYICILKNDEGYAPVSEEEQSIIKHFTGESDSVDMSLGVIRNGTLTVLDGPLKGMEDMIVKINRHHRKAFVKFDRLLGEERILAFGLEVVEKS